MSLELVECLCDTSYEVFQKENYKKNWKTIKPYHISIIAVKTSLRLPAAKSSRRSLATGLQQQLFRIADKIHEKSADRGSSGEDSSLHFTKRPLVMVWTVRAYTFLTTPKDYEASPVCQIDQLVPRVSGIEETVTKVNRRRTVDGRINDSEVAINS